jgi:periplasmic divalent cation tolerance protein
MGLVIIYVTHKDKESAEKIASILLDKKLIGCVNLFPINSMYLWDNKISSDCEYVTLFKTIPELYDKVVLEIENNHDYDIPCILRFDVKSNKKYEDWIKMQII